MIKTFKVQAEYNDLMYVVLQVDTDKLTPELATKLNSFCGRYARLESEDDDVVRAVVRLYGAQAIRKMLLSSGACFSRNMNSQAAMQWSLALENLLADMRHDFFDIDPGILVIEAHVEIPDFDSVELHDMTAASA